MPYQLNPRLRGWADGADWTIAAATYDSDGVMTTATVRWPDNSTGTWTRTSKNATFLTIDSYTITHAISGRTLTQPAVTRDSNGNVTVQPAITVT